MKTILLLLALPLAAGARDALEQPARRADAGDSLPPVRALEAGMPGTPAALFRADADIHGEPLDLASLIGTKHVLLDFWASWCLPCRRGNPRLKALHQKYKDDLVIVCIADDDFTPGKWRDAVEQDGLHDLHHVPRGLKRLPGGGFDRSGDIDLLYDIRALPTKILIDKSGTIIAHHGSDSDALDARLKEIFGR
jgi:thiol-disulfide isomerase/thioredoxin